MGGSDVVALVEVSPAETEDVVSSPIFVTDLYFSEHPPICVAPYWHNSSIPVQFEQDY